MQVSQDNANWQRSVRDAIRDPNELLDALGLKQTLGLELPTNGFPLFAPREFVQRMRRGDPKDPLLLQVMPRKEEFSDQSLPTDAVGDLPATKTAGLLQKYRGRVLMTLSSRCAVNCRYCFRRHYPYEKVPASDQAWEPALQYIEQNTSIHEVILSGGDPLMIGDHRLSRLVLRLKTLAHVRTLRVHSRLPVVIPSRITNTLSDLLTDTGMNGIFVLHINHANEVDVHVKNAVWTLREKGWLVMNQSVLLRDINDSVLDLKNLSYKLIDTGVIPYYLHQLDLVSGVKHFEVDIKHGVALIEELRSHLPGYAVPRFVEESPMDPYKAVLA